MSLTNPLFNRLIKERFRGFLPVVVDVETAGVNPQKNALLEMCIVLIHMDKHGHLYRGESHFEHILPFSGSELDPKSLEFNHIDPFQPLRFAIDEKKAAQAAFFRLPEFYFLDFLPAAVAGR
mgnify:CR=1 FL=1